MKKRIYQISAILLTVTILTVSASAANCDSRTSNDNSDSCYNNSWFSSCGDVASWFGSCEDSNESQPCKLLDSFQSEGWTICLPWTDCPTAVEPPITEPSEPEPETPPVTDPSIDPYESEVIDLVNEIRQSYGLGTLSANAALCDVARAKSQDMVDNNYFSHTSPTYGSPFDMMKAFGITYRTAGENIAYGYRTPAAVVDGWMNSEGHRANILSASFTEIGVGYVANGHYWTQMFIG